MKNKNILVVGYFGYVSNQLDGQTIKTRNIYELLKSKEEECNYRVSYFDTQSFQTKKTNIIKMYHQVFKYDLLIYIGAHSNLKYLFPVHYLITRIIQIDLHYIVVGGWLAEFLENKPIHRFMLKRIRGIYPQTKLLTEQLQEKYSFSNVVQLHNFRMEEPSSSDVISINKCSDKIKIVFMARIHPMKGVDVLFQLADHLNKLPHQKYCLDIYGPMFEEYRSVFENKIKRYSNIRYHGALLPGEINKTLREYDLMLFPTKYFTEGFPGSILDAYMAGLPVIATRWKYAEEFIDDGNSGVITEFDIPEDFIEKTINCIDRPEYLDQLKIGARKQSKKFSSEAAWNILKSYIK